MMIQDDPERKLKGLQLLSLSLFLIWSFGKLYSAINTPTSCISELNINIKSSLEIKEGLKFRNSQLPLSLDSFPYPFLSYKYPHTLEAEERRSRE